MLIIQIFYHEIVQKLGQMRDPYQTLFWPNCQLLCFSSHTADMNANDLYNTGIKMISGDCNAVNKKSPVLRAARIHRTLIAMLTSTTEWSSLGFPSIRITTRNRKSIVKPDFAQIYTLFVLLPNTCGGQVHWSQRYRIKEVYDTSLIITTQLDTASTVLHNAVIRTRRQSGASCMTTVLFSLLIMSRISIFNGLIRIEAAF